MERHVMWAPWDRPGLEHLHLLQTSEGVIANGLMIGVEADKPFRLQYEIHCDARYRVRKVSADLFGADRSIQLTADGDGHWFDRALA